MRVTAAAGALTKQSIVGALQQVRRVEQTASTHRTNKAMGALQETKKRVQHLARSKTVYDGVARSDVRVVDHCKLIFARFGACKQEVARWHVGWRRGQRGQPGRRRRGGHQVDQQQKNHALTLRWKKNSGLRWPSHIFSTHCGLVASSPVAAAVTRNGRKSMKSTRRPPALTNAQ